MSEPHVALPPHSTHAENAVLGSVMIEPTVIDTLTSTIGPEDFYLPDNAEIFRAVLSLHNAGLPPDAVTLSERLEAAGKFDEIGGMHRIGQLLEAVPHADNATYYAGIVRDKSIRRNLIATCRKSIAAAHDESRDAQTVLADADSRMARLLESQAGTRPTDITSILFEVNESLTRPERPGIRTGFSGLDELTGGLRPGHMAVLAARTSVGKTSFAGNLALNVAKAGCGVLFVTLEQPARDLAERFLVSVAGVDSHRVRNRNLDELDRDRLAEASSDLSKRPLWIVQPAPKTTGQIAAQARIHRRRHGIGLVIVDYLQLVEPSDRRQPREQQVASASRGLKGLAESLDVPLIALAQLNRQIEQRENKRPRLSDLRESAAIEQDADLVMFIDRPALHDPDASASEARLYLAKNRSGQTGTLDLHWSGSTMTFSDPEAPDYQGDF